MQTQAEFDATENFNVASEHDPEYSPDALHYDDPIDEIEQPPEGYIRIGDALESIEHLYTLDAVKREVFPNIRAYQRVVNAIINAADGAPVMPTAKAANAFRYALARVIDSNDPYLEAKCMAYSVGLAFNGNTETEMARAHGVAKQAVSKRIREFQQLHGIPSSLGNKRAGSREIYRAGNSRRTKV